MATTGSKSLIIKLIFEYQGERTKGAKIRKLVVEEGETPTLDFLRESFSLPHFKAFSYYDDDGDQITITNDRELQTAIDEKKFSDTLRLYIPEDDTGRECQGRNGKDHDDVFESFCTNCQSRMGRFTYKCVICTNIDLCGRCEAFGVHSIHDIIRLSNEKTYPSQFFTRLHRLYDKMNQTQSMISLHPLSSPPPSSQRPLGTIPSFSSESPNKAIEDFDLIEAESSPLTVKQFSKSDDSSSPEPNAKSSSPEEEHKESASAYRGVLQAPVTVLLKDEFQVHEAREANSEEIAGSLRGLRKEIDKLLIDEEDGKSSSDSASSKCTLVKVDSEGNDSNCPYDLIKVLSFEENDEEQPPSNKVNDPVDGEGLEPSSTTLPTTTIEDTKTSPTFPRSKTSYDYVPAYCPRTRNLLNESSLYSLKYNQSPYLTTTQKVSDSLEQMKAMGFTDDDGWLTQVLTMERGDIDKVLDILTPVHK